MIMIFCGTKEGSELTAEFEKEKVNFLASTATQYGNDLIKGKISGKYITGKLETDDIISKIRENNIKVIVDATHPFAVQIKKNIIKACESTNTPCIRYERENLKKRDLKGNIISVTNFEEAADIIREREGNVLVTTGTNNLSVFRDMKGIYIRVLPVSGNIKKCEDAGFTPDNIIAMKGPFTKEMNKAVLKFVNAKAMVTKESGRAGGTDTKLSAAYELNIPVIMIERPGSEYQVRVRDKKELIRKIKTVIKGDLNEK